MMEGLYCTSVNEGILGIDVGSLFPERKSDRDRCLDRLEAALQKREGIQRVHRNSEDPEPQLCLHYDPAILSSEQLHKIVKRASMQITKRCRHATIPIEGMDCSDCALVIEHSLSRTEGILLAEISYAEQRMRVTYDAQITSIRSIKQLVRRLGYSIPDPPLIRWLKDNGTLLASLLAGLMLLSAWLGGRADGMSPGALLALYAGSYTLAGFNVFLHTLRSLFRERRLSTDLLMLLAALGAVALGEWTEGALLLFLFSLGHALENRALDRARAAIQSLSALQPKTARILRDGKEFEVAAEEVKIGDRVLVPAGARLPIDGTIEAGHSWLDQSPVTGESVPVEVHSGDLVFAGSINGEGALEIKATRLSKDSTLARVFEMVEEAQTLKSPTERTSHRISGILVPTVLVAAAGLILIPPFFGAPFRQSFLSAMTLLVAASPCALALGTPSAILAALAQAARNGVLVKGGTHLETLGALRTLAFDKTGTITKGSPVVTDVIPSGSLTEDEILALAAAVERRSAHPLAFAIVKAASHLDLPKAENVQEQPGMGLRAMIEGRQVYVGNLNRESLETGPVPQELLAKLSAFEVQGKTVVSVGLNGRMIGLIAVADALRPEAGPAVEALRTLGIDPLVMLTGDRSRVAEHIAHQVGIQEVYANLMPAEKLEAIYKLSKAYKTVGMVGDGVNDAPALAAANIGIAMGGAKTGVALETADIVLMADDLSKLPFAVGLGRQAKKTIQQNMAIAIGVMAVLVGLTLANLAGITLAIVLHESSTLIVVFNALRLLQFKDPLKA